MSARHPALLGRALAGVAPARRRLLKVPAALAAAVLLPAVAAAPAIAIDEGVPDGSAHPNVALVGVDFDRGGPEPPTLWCTGFVVSDHVIVTAAHCIQNAPPDVGWVATLQGGSPASPVSEPGILFDDFPFSFLVDYVSANQAVAHPRFNGSNAHDLAVLVFDPGTFAGVTPLPLPAANLAGRLKHRLRGQPVTLVGYGVDPEGPGPTLINEGYRQTATAPLKHVTNQQVKYNGNARQTHQGGVCEGDSGSPQLLEDSGIAISLLSSSAEDCRGEFRGQRLDTAAERQFLSQYTAVP